MDETSNPQRYPSFLGEIKERIRSAQYRALRAVHRELIQLYWDIGKLIVERQRTEGWGRAIVQRLARDLQSEFPGTGGLSFRNLWYMRSLYSTYEAKPKLQPVVAEIGWTHNLIILDRCHDDQQREFYLRMTRRMGWSKVVLIHHIENKTFEKTLASQNNFAAALPEPIRAQAQLAIKDEYLFDFLELGEEHSERQLESAILARLGPFLREMGGVFAFLGNQFRLEVASEEYFLDLLLYHRELKSLVAIELKVGKFLPEFVGKMQFYLAVLDDKLRLPGESLSIGIILCKDKDETIVEYALRESKKPIGVASYRMCRELPDELKGRLPEPEQVARLLEGLSPS